MVNPLLPRSISNRTMEERNTPGRCGRSNVDVAFFCTVIEDLGHASFFLCRGIFSPLVCTQLRRVELNESEVNAYQRSQIARFFDISLIYENPWTYQMFLKQYTFLKHFIGEGIRCQLLKSLLEGKIDRSYYRYSTELLSQIVPLYFYLTFYFNLSQLACDLQKMWRPEYLFLSINNLQLYRTFFCLN